MGSQRDSLQKIAELIRRGSVHPEILKAAKILTRDCDARDDECELEAIFNAVKNGDSRVPWLKSGIRYVSDPRAYDTFYTAQAMIDSCKSGACAADCDDMTVIIGSMAAALGFKVGARAWGPAKNGDYQHVYAVAAAPKNGPWPKAYCGTAMDPTVKKSYLGWEPDGGRILTAWIE